MKPSETAELLGLCQAADSRTIGEGDVAMWHATIGDLPLEDGRAAVIAFYSESTDGRRIMPGHVRAGVKRLRADRLERLGAAALDPPDADPDDVAAYITALRADRRRSGDGTRSLHPSDVDRVFKRPGELSAMVVRELPVAPPAEVTTHAERMAEMDAMLPAPVLALSEPG